MAPLAPRGQRGFSLVELMVALVAGLIVSAAALSFFFSSMVSNGKYVQSTRVTQELRNSLDLISRDLRRAGYDQNALGLLATATASPFSRICRTTGGSATCITFPGAGVGDCILYAYDGTANPGKLLVAGNYDVGEIRGIRRKVVNNANGVSVGVIEYAVNTATAKPSCADASANYTTFPATCNGTWCALSDPSKMDITTLGFTDLGAVTGAVQMHDIQVSLQGRTAGTTDTVRGVKGNVRIRTECYDATLTNCTAAP